MLVCVICNLSSWEVEKGGGGQEFKGSLNYMRCCFKKMKSKQINKQTSSPKP